MRLALFVIVLFAASCVGELTEEGRCGSAGECLLGFECVENFCLRCSEGGCNSLQYGTVGPNEGGMCSADDFCLFLPAQSLSEPTEVFIRRGTRAVPSQYDARSIVFEAGPASTQLDKDVMLRIPISPSNPFENIACYVAPSAGAAFERLESAPSERSVDTYSDRLGFFFCGRERDGS